IKVWDDADDQDGKRPETLTVKLLADGEDTGKTVVLNSANKWTGSISKLPKNKAGKAITYTWSEETLPTGYSLTKTELDKTGYITTLTNSYTPEEVEVSVIKVWDDADNQDGKRPETLTVKLLADGEDTGKTVVLNAANKWTGSISKLPKNKAGKAITYTWSEDTLPEGYTLTKTETDETGCITTLTNSYTPDKISINVEKQWRDDDNRDGLRPQSIHVQLKADGKAFGEPVELSEANNWKHTWTELDKNAEGKEIEYTVEETDLPAGYGITVNGTPKEGFLIINPHDPEKIEVEGVKIWQGETDKDHQRPGSVIIRLYADGAEIDYAVVSEATNWTFKFTDLYKYKAGKEIRYTITEDPVVGYSTNINGTTVTNTWTPPETPPTGDSGIIATVAMLFTSALGIAFALERKRRRNIEAE
ncbi:MAG: Cna B-type domain-containing protein, partial [Clostridia bacterium]|nr:Cna B-type domain-containing protein [Clostridia bacterium]